MSGCLVGLISRLIFYLAGVIMSLVWILLLLALRVIRFLVLVMFTANSSLFVGVRTAVDRLSQSWIEQSTGQGVMVGYNPGTRGSMKAAAWLLLIVGWLLTIGAIYLAVRLIAN